MSMEMLFDLLELRELRKSTPFLKAEQLCTQVFLKAGFWTLGAKVLILCFVFSIV